MASQWLPDDRLDSFLIVGCLVIPEVHQILLGDVLEHAGLVRVTLRQLGEAAWHIKLVVLDTKVPHWPFVGVKFLDVEVAAWECEPELGQERQVARLVNVVHSWAGAVQWTGPSPAEEGWSRLLEVAGEAGCRYCFSCRESDWACWCVR